MTAEQLWNEFIKNTSTKNQEYNAWAFGASADLLAKLVTDGIKTATASAYPLYQFENEPLPKAGTYSVILDSKEEAVCIIQITKVYVVPFSKVSEDHAHKEGEGDRSLKYWRQVHKEFFEDCLKESGQTFDENLEVVCEEFKLVFQA